MNEAIEIRLKGEGIHPGLVRSHEIAEILEAVEDLVSFEAERVSPEVRREDIVVGLFAVADQSIGLRFKASLAAITIPAFVAASELIAIGSFHDLTPQSRKALQAIAGFAKRHGATAEFKIAGQEAPIATINAETIIPEEVRISGLTEITARTIRVGGKVPRAMLEMLDGTVIYCEVSSDIAMELGHHLYKLGTFKGLATWLAGNLQLDEFRIQAFHPFPGRDPVEMLSELRGVIGVSLANLGDVDQVATRLRRDEDEA
jgi:hypothetical protein